jgi:hypothetical protein
MNDLKHFIQKGCRFNLETKKFRIVTKPIMIFNNMKGLQKPIEFLSSWT